MHPAESFDGHKSFRETGAELTARILYCAPVERAQKRTDRVPNRPSSLPNNYARREEVQFAGETHHVCACAYLVMDFYEPNSIAVAR